jgi:hypothetical protein
MAAKKRHLKAVASTPNINGVLRKMPIDYMMCRDFGHAWQAYTVDVDGVHRTFVETLECWRCKSFRVRTITRQGKRSKNHYNYSEGYLVSGWGSMSADDRAKLRLALVQTLLSQQQAKETGLA